MGAMVEQGFFTKGTRGGQLTRQRPPSCLQKEPQTHSFGFPRREMEGPSRTDPAPRPQETRNKGASWTVRQPPATICSHPFSSGIGRQPILPAEA